MPSAALASTPSPAPTLVGQMLCASVYAYAIQPDGTFNASYPPYDAASGLSSPTPIVAGADSLDINACLVGLSTAQDAVVVAFRGTLPPSERSITTLIDWMNDFYAAPMTVTGIPGSVHSGFWDGLDSLWATLLPQVKTLMQGSGGQTLPLYITGHSKGGALASLAAARFHFLEGIEPTAIYTFASPMPGDDVFAASYPYNGIHSRYEYQDDIVPNLPPDSTLVELLQAIPDIGKYFDGMQSWDYTPVGTLQFINWSDQIVGASPLLAAQRVLSLLKLMGELQFSTIMGDHGADCGDGYMTVLNPTGVCSVSRPMDILGMMAAKGFSVAGLQDARGLTRLTGG